MRILPLAPRVGTTSNLLIPSLLNNQVVWQSAQTLALRTQLQAAAQLSTAAAVASIGTRWSAVLALASLFAWRRPLDPGSTASGWLDEEGATVYDRNGVTVTQVDASDALGGQWRSLRTARGQVVQSAVRLVDGSLHPGALAGYTRVLGATALAAAPRKLDRVLNLGLGGGSVPNFLCAHANASVVAVDKSRAVVAAARAT